MSVNGSAAAIYIKGLFLILLYDPPAFDGATAVLSDVITG